MVFKERNVQIICVALISVTLSDRSVNSSHVNTLKYGDIVTYEA